LAKEASINEKGGEKEQTPLHLAAQEGKTAVVEILLREGADKELRDRDEHTPLELAQLNSHGEVVKRLEASTQPKVALQPETQMEESTQSREVLQLETQIERASKKAKYD
ncbi:MAG: ankyrin repeat domain-containing protein, partial [Cytophagales bacterium]|nr:ankyrin repeat domain-containing protein [Cytophagales bacterium]